MAGLNLLDMLTGPTGRRAVTQMGQQFGLDETQSSQAVAALLPALSSGLKRNVGQPGGLEALVGALSKGQHTQYLDEPETLAKPETVDDGNAILGHLLGSKDISRAAAARGTDLPLARPPTGRRIFLLPGAARMSGSTSISPAHTITSLC